MPSPLYITRVKVARKSKKGGCKYGQKDCIRSKKP